jgi:hypothetical protein
MRRVRTNIEIEEAYLRAVMDCYGVHTRPKRSTSPAVPGGPTYNAPRGIGDARCPRYRPSP